MTSPLIKGFSGTEGDALTYASTNENNKAIHTFTANEEVTWSIIGGEKSLFEIDSSSGALSFRENPDFEKAFDTGQTIAQFGTTYSNPEVSDEFYMSLYDGESSENIITSATARNFLDYVSDGSYKNTIIHRLVPDFVIQSGGYKQPPYPSNEEGGIPSAITSKGTIINEPGNSSLMGTIAMAKVSGLPDSATSQWFINLKDNIHLDSQNGGFSVFGHMLGDGIENPLLLNSQTRYNVIYDTLTLPELPLFQFQSDGIIRPNNYFAITNVKIVSERPEDISAKYNVVISAQDVDGNTSNQYVIVSINDIQGENLLGGLSDDNFYSGIGDDIFDGKEGIDTVFVNGSFKDYLFTREVNSIQLSDQRSGTNDGIDSLTNIEFISFSDQTVEESKVDIVKTYSGVFSDYKFYNKGNGVFQIKTDSGFDNITGLPLLTFTGEVTTSAFRDISAIVDIKGTFDQVTGFNSDDAKMFRLYNAAFKRLPDANGLKYWIEKYSSGENDDRAVASSFLVSDEFSERYGSNVSNAKYVETLYINVLGRDYDQDGYNYWLGNLNAGIETRYEVLIGFAESGENKALFSEITGFA